MATLTLTPAELRLKQLDPANLAAGEDSLRKFGYVVLANAVPLPILANIQHRMSVDTPRMLRLHNAKHGHGPHVCELMHPRRLIEALMPTWHCVYRKFLTPNIVTLSPKIMQTRTVTCNKIRLIRSQSAAVKR
eukprot:SAG31_NODE_4982_length_2820_cov_3.084160_2_plen_133_part_00